MMPVVDGRAGLLWMDVRLLGIAARLQVLGIVEVAIAIGIQGRRWWRRVLRAHTRRRHGLERLRTGSVNRARRLAGRPALRRLSIVAALRLHRLRLARGGRPPREAPHHEGARHSQPGPSPPSDLRIHRLLLAAHLPANTCTSLPGTLEDTLSPVDRRVNEYRRRRVPQQPRQACGFGRWPSGDSGCRAVYRASTPLNPIARFFGGPGGVINCRIACTMAFSSSSWPATRRSSSPSLATSSAWPATH